MNSITVCDVEFDIHPGNIAASVSGGADSAIMLYMILANCPGPVAVYTCSSREKGWVSPTVAYSVMLRCIELTGRTDIEHHTYFVEQQTRETLFRPLAQFILTHNHPIMYTAVTAIPPREVTASWGISSGVDDRRDPAIIRPLYNGPRGEFYSPFFNIDKRKIRELYDHYGLLDGLYPITRSCESFTLRSGHCGRCWWCRERLWAFGKY